MEYRGIEYTVVRDEGGDWQWAVSLGSPETIKSGQAASKGTAILKVWAAIDRAHRRASWKSRLNVAGKEVPPQNRQGVQGLGEADVDAVSAPLALPFPKWE